MASKPKNKGLINRNNIGDTYIKITPENRKHCITLGRIIYSLVDHDKTYMKVSTYFDIRPLHIEGWMKISGWPGTSEPYSVKVQEDEDPEDYKSAFTKVLEEGIEAGKLYIKKNQPLMTYE